MLHIGGHRVGCEHLGHSFCGRMPRTSSLVCKIISQPRFGSCLGFVPEYSLAEVSARWSPCCPCLLGGFPSFAASSPCLASSALVPMFHRFSLNGEGGHIICLSVQRGLVSSVYYSSPCSLVRTSPSRPGSWVLAHTIFLWSKLIPQNPVASSFLPCFVPLLPPLKDSCE